jgi:hypothetical protein
MKDHHSKNHRHQLPARWRRTGGDPIFVAVYWQTIEWLSDNQHQQRDFKKHL